jgi:hypothetical protein
LKRKLKTQTFQVLETWKVFFIKIRLPLPLTPNKKFKQTKPTNNEKTFYNFI